MTGREHLINLFVSLIFWPWLIVWILRAIGKGASGDKDVIGCPVRIANLPGRCSPVGQCEVHGCTREDCYCRAA